MRETYRWSRQLSWLVVLLLVLMLGAGDAAAAELKKFTLINVVLDGTKIWLPSSLMVYQGEEVELTLINKLEDPHGFKIADVGIEEVVQPKAQTTVKFTASQPGAHSLLDGQLSKLSFFTQRPGTGNRDAFGNRGDIDAWKPSRVQGPRHWTSAR